MFLPCSSLYIEDIGKCTVESNMQLLFLNKFCDVESSY